MTDQAARTTVEADVLEREVIDENLLRRLLQRAGRGLAAPALEALELMLDPETLSRTAEDARCPELSTDAYRPNSRPAAGGRFQ